MSTTLIVNARLVNDGREVDGDLRTWCGRVDQAGPELLARDGEPAVDAAPRRLLRVMIDDQVHFREPGIDDREDILRERHAADRVRFDDPPFTVQRRDVPGTCGWSAFVGTTFHGRIAATRADGMLASNGTSLPGEPVGKRLQFDR